MSVCPQTGRDNRNVLRIKDLSLNFKTTRGMLKALREVSLDIPPKRIVGLVGESGCGKSTVINAILNLLAENAHIQSGLVEFKGRNILDMTQDQLREIRGDRISVVFPGPHELAEPGPVHRPPDDRYSIPR